MAAAPLNDNSEYWTERARAYLPLLSCLYPNVNKTSRYRYSGAITPEELQTAIATITAHLSTLHVGWEWQYRDVTVSFRGPRNINWYVDCCYEVGLLLPEPSTIDPIDDPTGHARSILAYTGTDDNVYASAQEGERHWQRTTLQ